MFCIIFLTLTGEECRKRYADLTTEKKVVPVPVENEKSNSSYADKHDSKTVDDAADKIVHENKNHTKLKDLEYYSPRYDDEKWDCRDGKKRSKRCKRDKYRDREREKREDSYGRSSHRNEFTTSSTPTPNSSVASSDLGYGMSHNLDNFISLRRFFKLDSQ